MVQQNALTALLLFITVAKRKNKPKVYSLFNTQQQLRSQPLNSVH